MELRQRRLPSRAPCPAQPAAPAFPPVRDLIRDCDRKVAVGSLVSLAHASRRDAHRSCFACRTGRAARLAGRFASLADRPRVGSACLEEPGHGPGNGLPRPGARPGQDRRQRRANAIDPGHRRGSVRCPLRRRDRHPLRHGPDRGDRRRRQPGGSEVPACSSLPRRVGAPERATAPGRSGTESSVGRSRSRVGTRPCHPRRRTSSIRSRRPRPPPATSARAPRGALARA